jgi:glyoxylase-like metal-dependent hydrolase (beta-lactamase superfamily II)
MKDGLKTMEITNSVHLIDNIRGVNCYLVITDTGMLLVDTGMPGSADKIIKYVGKISKNTPKITHIIITHADIDHIGSAAAVKKITGAKLVIHAEDAPILAGKKGLKAIRGPMAVPFKLLSRLMRAQPVEPDIVITKDFEIDGFKVIHTPGHTSGSICLYKPGSIIFVGDALKSDKAGNPTPFSRLMSSDPAQARASLDAIAQLDYDICLTGHGAPIKGNAAAKIKELLARMK